MASTAKRLGKRIVGYPEEIVPVISARDYVLQATQDPIRRILEYIASLFPILGWITRYNLGWLTGDVIAGLTVGIVLVPQSMSYAQIATLSPEYGLYSSFIGVLLYCVFATSKDVSIGPVAVMSLTVSQIIKHVDDAHPGKWEGPQIATTVAFIAGFIVLGIGLLRLGWLVEFIPAPAVSAFMTGSAISIVSGQIPGLMGISGFDTRAATYEVIINTLKGLPRTKLDAAWGLPGLVALYIIRFSCDRLAKRFPRRARILFFISVFRNVFVILILTIAAWLYTRHRQSASGSYPIKILKDVPGGLRHVGQPVIDPELVTALAGQLPIAVIILLLEHIAIAKSFGRLNGYKINPNQELIAIGVTNTVGSCFAAYPATGSFSRSALQSKSGVRTPAGGIVTAAVVIVALYGVTPAFYWIPTAGLSAVIIHAVADLVATPKQVYSYWRVSPMEFIIWLAAVIITIFSSIENGIYASICASLVLLLVRVAHPRGYFLGKVTVHNGVSEDKDPREVFVPLTKDSVTNTQVKVIPPSPGVIIYRLEESYLYPNCAQLDSILVDYVKENTRRGKDMSVVKRKDRAWNDPGPRRGTNAEYEANTNLPLLRVIVLDFSGISQIDTTAVQSLIDTRNEIERWADRSVEVRLSLLAKNVTHTTLVPLCHDSLSLDTSGPCRPAVLGTGSPSSKIPQEIAAVVPYRDSLRDNITLEPDPKDIERGDKGSTTQEVPPGFAPLLPVETPFFHFDLAAAVRAAENAAS
ncbi:sulfate transporter family-domain-containing protein [Desarmillaria tabescens]|uniref:Sulfate transporter family-domain-containing protein n=1 Tax=Armillaria tabescens TaxID=1929756 RepID=A0AA39N6C3_ARMTA|nr:sulfate transporter family-domain-containing protein [Desarmillaria tabescens]KAK0459512.1 sulfate transporter family-domain-containing protein [Desarmillaria tabescens]